MQKIKYLIDKLSITELIKQTYCIERLLFPYYITAQQKLIMGLPDFRQIISFTCSPISLKLYMQKNAMCLLMLLSDNFDGL